MVEWLEDLGLPASNAYELTRKHQSIFRRASHTATSGLDIRNGAIALTQQFREGKFYGASAVVAAVLDRPAQARYLNETTVRLTAAPGRGKFVILVGAAASFDAAEDIASKALDAVTAARPKGFAGLQRDTAEWWHNFWAQGQVQLTSADGQADLVEQNYTYFLYLMNTSSHGKYPPRFGGMIWYSNGDMRAWGSEHWWANTSAYYRNLMPAGRLDLMDPLFSMYSGMYDSAARAAVQQWGSQGVWIPETVWFDGLENLPEDIASEMQDLYLVRKPWDQRSARFMAWAATKMPHYSRYSWIDKGKYVDGNWLIKPKRDIAFGHTSHILSVGSRLSVLYWQRYQFTMDQAWLRERAYPMIKGSAEFYRNFPNFQKEADGKYHLHHVNNSEGQWDLSDTPYEMDCVRIIFPLAARAAEILGVDEELRSNWREISANLAPNKPVPGRQLTVVVPKPPGGENNLPRAPIGNGGFGGFIGGGDGGIAPKGPQEELKALFPNFNRTGGFVDEPSIGGPKIFRNRLRLREGPGAIDAEHIGGLTHGVHAALLDSTPESEEGEPLLRLFPLWPNDWDADFTLLARGAFLVSAAQKDGVIQPVVIVSQQGTHCRVGNPWRDAVVHLERNGKSAETLSGTILEFSTTKGEKVKLAPLTNANRP